MDSRWTTAAADLHRERRRRRALTGAAALTAGLATAAALGPAAQAAPAGVVPGFAGARTVATEGSGPSYGRLPGVAGDARAVGAHDVTVLPIYWNGTRPTAPAGSVVATTVREAGVYYRAASGGEITVALDDMLPWARARLTETEAEECSVTAIQREVRKIVPSLPSSSDHLAVIFPRTSACDFGTSATRGPSSAGGGLALFNGSFATAPLVYALGSNMGLASASSLDCWTDAAHTNTTPLSEFCREQTGGDPWDPMGSAPYGKLGQLSAANLADLGVLDDTEFVDLVPGSAQYVFVRPVTTRTGTRGFAVNLGSRRYTVEYRTATGLDTWVDDASVTLNAQAYADPGGGVIVRYQDLQSEDPEETFVLDFHADGTVAPTGRHPGMEVGQAWMSPGGVMRVEVLAAGDSGAQLKVDFPGLNKVERWAGEDRFATSAAISARTFAGGVRTAYISSGLVYPDALSGAPVAGRDGGPILLVDTDEVPGAVQNELRRLQPEQIVVLGGESTVSEAVVKRLGAFTRGGVERWSGDDRFTTSAAISARSFSPGVSTAFIASGRVYTDALSGAPVAGKTDNPVLLVDTASVPSAVAAELTRLKPGRIIVFGGPSTVTPNVLTRLGELTDGPVVRWSGADRYATSAAISALNYGPGVSELYIASGQTFPDALSGAPAAGMKSGPILLVEPGRVPPSVADEIDRLQPRRIIILGGVNSVSESVRAVLGSYLP